MTAGDIRHTPEYAAVAEHLRRLHEPAFGRPHLLAEPHVTADGTRVVVTGSVLDELAGKPRTAVYTVADGRLEEVTAGAGSARWGRFSPDGRTLAVLADPAGTGVFQLHLLQRDRFGEAEPAPPVPGTVEYAHWSPDGRLILLGVAGLGAELAGGQGSGTNVAAAAGLPAWHPVVEEGVPASAWRSLWLYAPATGELSRLSPEGVNCWEAGWCGPSAVVAVSSDGPAEDDWYAATLRRFEVGTKECRELLRGDVQLGLPAGSPDGRHVSVVAAVCSDRWIVAGDLTVLDLASGTRRRIDTAGTDVTCVQWIDATRLGYLGQRRLESVAGVLDLATGETTEVFSTGLSCGGRYPEGAFTADGRVAVVRSGYEEPPQLALVAGDGEAVLASTAHPGTDYLLSVAGQAEPVSWTAPDGLEIDGILCAPPGRGPFPMVVNVHGGPISAVRDTWSMGRPYTPLLVSRGYAVLWPNPRGSGGRGQEFAGRVVGDMGGADAGDILAGVDAMVERGVAHPARLGLIGQSYGGFMSSWLVTRDRRFRAAVPIAPVTDWYSFAFTSNLSGWARRFLGGADPEQAGTAVHERSPVLRASKARTPCLVVAGGLDRCTPPTQAQEFHRALLAQGVESALVIYPKEGHGVRAYPAVIDFVARVATWFGRHLESGDE